MKDKHLRSSQSPYMCVCAFVSLLSASIAVTNKRKLLTISFWFLTRRQSITEKETKNVTSQKQEIGKFHCKPFIVPCKCDEKEENVHHACEYIYIHGDVIARHESIVICNGKLY